MAFVDFSGSGYEYMDSGYNVLFFEDNTHSLLFEYAAKDLSSLPRLFAEYMDARLDATLAPIGDRQNGTTVGQIIEVLKSAHKYYVHEYRRTILNEIGNYFNELLLFLCYKSRTLDSSLPQNKEWYSERIEWLMYPLLEIGDTYPVDFYNKYADKVGTNFHIPADSEEDFETFVYGVPREYPSGFRNEIRIQKTVCDMLYFILDIKAQDIASLTKPQRMWLFANLFPDGASEVDIVRKLSFCSKPRFRRGNDRSQDIEGSQILRDIFDQLHSIDSRSIAEMNGEMQSCFTLAIKTAEDIQTSPIYEEYEIDSLEQLLYLEVISMIQDGIMIRRCKNCGKYFIAANRKITYCNRMDKDTGKCCSDIGSQVTYKNKLKEDNVLKIYNRAYKTHFARFKNDIITREQLDDWRIKAKEKLEQARAGVLDASEFEKWLKK